MPELVIKKIAIEALKPYKNNPRKHPKKQIKQLKESIVDLGTITTPLLVDENNIIIAGHGRLRAAQELGLKEVPCIVLSHLADAQKALHRISDNKIAENATWDFELLATELALSIEQDPDICLENSGFSIPEIETIFNFDAPEDEGDPAEDALPDKASQHLICYPGDIWQLDTHRLICGDALDADNIAFLMNGHKAAMVFTDSPYNVSISGNVCGKGSIQHKEFAMASGEMSSEEFVNFLKAAIRNLITFSKNGSIHYLFMDWRHMSEILEAGNELYTELKNMIVWVKDNGGMGTFYRSRHELIFVFKNGTAPHINNFELGQHGRHRTNVWEYRGMSSRGSGRLEELALHPTVKPVQMIADAMKDCSARGDIVLDIFGGSGSTLIAAEKTGRRAYLAEIDPEYCATIIARWQDYTHDEAELIHRDPAFQTNTTEISQ